MKRLRWMRVVGSLALLLVALVAESAEPPNFIVILGEAQGWTSASVSMDDTLPDAKSPLAHTPNLEKLAAGGMRFANFHAAAPRCTPTRAALFTGRSPAALHMTFVGEGNRGRESGYAPAASPLVPAEFVSELPAAETTLGELLQSAGYATAHFGKWHVGRVSPAQHGFAESDGATNNDGPDHVENPNPKQAFGLTERGLEFMARQAKAGKPFYLQLSHYPGRGGPDARPATYEAVRQRATSERDRRLVGAAAVTEDMDATIGLVLAQLADLHLAGRTYLFYTSDHGAIGRSANSPLASGKGTVWEGGLRVPLIARGPGIPAGACTHVAASTVDLLPTIAALAGLAGPLPAALEGGSLAAVLTAAPGAKVRRPRDEFVVHVPHYDKGDQAPAAALFLGNLKLIRSFETGAVQLFDLALDLGERRDLAPSRPREAADLDQQLSDYLATVKARLPTRNLPAPPN
ncbi:MAG: arylsulfatase [Chthoniobacter sp.]|jgi:arylsulfatase A-like enzyme|nr:arylsulfatase [Chthoniobacter sp.]